MVHFFLRGLPTALCTNCLIASFLKNARCQQVQSKSRRRIIRLQYSSMAEDKPMTVKERMAALARASSGGISGTRTVKSHGACSSTHEHICAIYLNTYFCKVSAAVHTAVVAYIHTYSEGGVFLLFTWTGSLAFSPCGHAHGSIKFLAKDERA